MGRWQHERCYFETAGLINLVDHPCGAGHGDPKALKKVTVRHNLGALRDLCQGVGFSSTLPQMNQIVDVIGEHYAAHEYRYMKPNTTLHYVDGNAAVPVVQTFVDEVAQEVGLPIRPSPN